MARFQTHAVLGVSTGRLMGDIGGIYEVMSFMMGRPAYTHELAYYGKRAEVALRTACPDLPGEVDFAHVTPENFLAVRGEWEAKLGNVYELPDSLRECLADEKNAIETAEEMAPGKVVVVVRP